MSIFDRLNIRGLLQDEEFLFGAGLLSAGSMGQSFGQAAFPTLINSARTANMFQNQQRMRDLRDQISGMDMSGFSDIEKALITADPFKSIDLLKRKKKERRIIKAADGFQYYADTGDRVLPGVEKNINLPTKEVFDDLLKKNVLKTEPEIQANSARFFPKKDLSEAKKQKKSMIENFQSIYRQNDVVKNYNTAQEQINKVLAGAKQDSAAGDVSLIFTFMKVLDPTSVVREGEQATAANAAGVPSRVRNAFNKALTGEKLSLPQRKDFVSTAIKLFQTNQKALDQFRSSFDSALNEREIKKSDVFFDSDFRPKQIKNASGQVIDVPPGTILEEYDINTNEFIYRMPDGRRFKVKR